MQTPECALSFGKNGSTRSVPTSTSGLTGSALLLILLTTLLGFISILSSWTAITERLREYYCYFLLLQTGMLGVFMALDFVLFYVFWEFMLVPMYFIIGVWGGPRKLYAAIKFFLYTLGGSVLLLLGILALYFYQYQQTGIWSFDVLAMRSLDLPVNLQWWIFIALFVGFAIKVPMFPFHTWLPDAHVEAPTAGSVILAAGPAENGHLWLCPLQSSDPPRSDHAAFALAAAAVCDRHHLRSSGGDDAEGHEEAGCLFLGKPSGVLHAGRVRGDAGGAGRWDSADDQPRDLNGSPLPDRGHRLRKASHAADFGIWPGLSPHHAGVWDGVSDHDHVFDWACPHSTDSSESS